MSKTAAQSPISSYGRGRAFSIILLLGACAGAAQPSEPGLPDGAIKIGESLYAVPLAERDGDGCRPYRLWSPDRMVTQALQYRKADGGFSMNKLEAKCMQGKARERYQGPD